MMKAFEPLSSTAVAIAPRSSFVNTRPVGFDGLMQMTTFVRDDNLLWNSSRSKAKSFLAGKRYVTACAPSILAIIV